MNIEFSKHLVKRCNSRGIDLVWVKETMLYPDVVVHKGYKYYAIKKLNGKTLKIVYVKEKHIKLITAYFLP